MRLSLDFACLSYLAIQADIIAALTVEILKGNVMLFDTDRHAARPYRGNIEVNSNRIRSLCSNVYNFINKTGYL